MKQEIDYRALVLKFLAREISDNEIDLLKGWLEVCPENRRIFDEENELWQKTGIGTKFSQTSTDTMWLEISEQLGILSLRIGEVVFLNRNKFRVLIAAASFAFLIVMGGISYSFIERKPDKRVSFGSTIVSTDEGEIAHVLLSDSTYVTLNSCSNFEYSTDFNARDRFVKLVGEAFFDVQTNPKKPFTVQLGGMRVIATGTKFNICSYDNDDRIETTLEEGNLHVAISGMETYELSVGQQIIYFPKTNKTVVRDVKEESYSLWKENKLRFVDTSFEEILKKISRKYNVTFEVKDQDLFHLKYTATFIDESIEDVMHMLKTVSPIDYRIYKRTTVNDKQYLKPKIVIEKKKT